MVYLSFQTNGQLRSKMNKIRFTTDEEKEYLTQAVEMVVTGALALRPATDWLESKTGKRISYEGLRKIIKRQRQESQDGDEEGVGTPSREVSPE